MVFRWGQSLGTNLAFQESFPHRYLTKILASFVYNQVRSFNLQIIWIDLAAFEVIKVM